MSADATEARVPRLSIGVSACLLGQEVCYNGGHKRDGFVAVTLAPYVNYVPVCPEVAIAPNARDVPCETLTRRRMDATS